MSHGDRRRTEEKISEVVLYAEKKEIDDELRAHLACYLCVLSSGYIEAAFRDIVAKYVDRRADISVKTFVKKNIDWFQNPKTENALRLIETFDSDIAKRLDLAIDDSWREAVNSLVGNKNLVAHGRDSQISIYIFKKYYALARLFVAKVEEEFLKDR